MPTCLIKGIQDKLWIEYANYDGELQIDAIYLHTDPNKTDIYDYLTESVLEKADSSMREDYAELKVYMEQERYKCARYYDEQGGWL